MDPDILKSLAAQLRAHQTHLREHHCLECVEATFLLRRVIRIFDKASEAAAPPPTMLDRRRQ